MPASLHVRKQKNTVDPRRPSGPFGRGRGRDRANVPPHDPLRHIGRWRRPGDHDEQPIEEPQPDRPD